MIEKAKAFAAHLLEASADDLEFSGGRFTVKGTDKGMAITEVALATFAAHNLPDGVEPSIDADATYDPVNFSFPHGTHLCAMEVDTETGATTMRKYVCVDDIGKIINPLIVEGQVHGGLVQGIAQALWEGAEYDDQGTLVTGSFVDYTLPTAADTISFVTDHTTSPSTTNTARHQGRRRGRHHRLDPGGRQRHRGCRASPRRRRRPDAVHAGAGVEGDPVGRGGGPAGARVGQVRTRVGHGSGHGQDRVRATGRALTGAGPAALRGRLPQPGPLSGRDGRSSTVIPAAFDYLAPTTVDEALAALAEGGDDAKVLGGGQSLLPILRMRLNAPDTLVDLSRIEALRGIRDEGDHLVIGAMTPYSDLLESDLVHEHAALLAKAVAEVADPQIRHRGTIGGALVHADPAGDVGAPVLALDAELRHRRCRWRAHRAGERVLPRPVRDLGRRGRAAHLGAHPQAHRLGVALREVRARLAPVVDRRDRRDAQGRGRHDHARPGSG